MYTYTLYILRYLIIVHAKGVREVCVCKGHLNYRGINKPFKIEHFYFSLTM